MKGHGETFLFSSIIKTKEETVKRRFLIVATGLTVLLTAAGWQPVFAGTEKFDAAMQPVLAEYLAIVDRLASDRTEGVADAAKKIEQLAAGVSPADVTGEHAAHYAGIPGKIAENARKMAAAKDLESLRTALVDLSKPMAMWATMSRPSGVNVVFCSMKPGSWLQKGAQIHNPYYGAAMSSCGEIISGPDAKK